MRPIPIRVTVSTECTATCCSQQRFIFHKENCAKTYPFHVCFECTSTYFEGFARIYSRTLFPFAALLATELSNSLISILLRMMIMIQSVRIRMEINIHCLCGSNWYMVFIPLETYLFLALLTHCQENFVSNGITTIYPIEPHKQCTFIS